MLAMSAPPAKQRRLRGKQPALKAAAVVDPTARFAELATAEELAHPLAKFAAAGVRRKNTHWTHGRSANPAHVQPDAMSREEFWEHLAKVHPSVVGSRRAERSSQQPQRSLPN